MSLDDVLAQQAGVISRDQALGVGLSRNSIDHRVRVRRWRPLHPCVYLAAGHRLDDEVRIRAALLWASDGAILSGWAAAWWCELTAQPPAAVAVTVPRRRQLRVRPDVDVRRHDIPEPDRAVHRGLAVTAPALTVLEAAVEMGDSGSRFVDDVLRRGAVLFADVHAAHSRNAGAAGSAAVGRLLAAVVDRSAADARRKLLVVLRGSRASGWTDSFQIAGHSVDVAFPAARVAVVVSGWAEPSTVLRAKAGAELQQAAAARGWTLLRYTWLDLNERPQMVMAQIAQKVARGMTVVGRTG
ncbi:MAG TPA: hypothetical protein VGE11_00160 [Pseudonocardia sp.]